MRPISAATVLAALGAAVSAWGVIGAARAHTVYCNLGIAFDVEGNPMSGHSASGCFGVCPGENAPICTKIEQFPDQWTYQVRCGCPLTAGGPCIGIFNETLETWTLVCNGTCSPCDDVSEPQGGGITVKYCACP